MKQTSSHYTDCTVNNGIGAILFSTILNCTIHIIFTVYNHNCIVYTDKRKQWSFHFLRLFEKKLLKYTYLVLTEGIDGLRKKNIFRQ